MVDKSERVLFGKDGGIARITLNRPEVRNCVDRQTLEELLAALDDCEGDASVRVVVLAGAGDAFSSGADLKYLRTQDARGFASFIELFHAVCRKIEALSKPVIAAVNGIALAGGLELALACDLVVAAEDAPIGDHHANIGTIPGGGSTQRLPRIVGIRRAKELIFTGERLTARQAEAMGLVNRVAPAGQLDDLVMELARSLTAKDPWVLKTAKHLINQGMQADLNTGLKMEEQAITQRRFDAEARHKGEGGSPWTSS
ncbi:MAG: enoyl-CoA hydratase/isomerase family protein [Dehalococcoidia bacterium]|nr:enoyl-CoA hydratase/isomerase family protein [Dehalococcoidia bacterium]